MSANSLASGIGPLRGDTNDTPWQREVRERLNLALQGKISATASITLAAGATSTVLTDSRIRTASVVTLTATTANAAAATGLYVTTAQGSATIHHNNTADTDRTFDVLIIG